MVLIEHYFDFNRNDMDVFSKLFLVKSLREKKLERCVKETM